MVIIVCIARADRRPKAAVNVKHKPVEHKLIAAFGQKAKAVSGGIGEGVKASYTMKPDDLYVRARILSPERPLATAFQHPKVHVAWTQPYLRA